MKTILLSVLALPFFLLMGCQQGVSPPIQGRQDPYAENQVTFASEDLRRHTALDRPNLSRDPDTGILYVQIPIRATGDQNLYIDYRFTFKDRNGQDLWTTTWLHKVLNPHVNDSIQGNSTDARAVDFRLDVRYSK
ncbi:MAG: DUF1425 domain-containing protein [Phycisphaerales bacterium]|jgi:uncharacterized protein YcfL|nr:DUF1425 domain-containing protein [Phycisphaerales bacterium]